MTRSSHSSQTAPFFIASVPVGVLLVLLLGGCATTGSGASDPNDEQETRQYQEDYRTTVTTVGQALVDIGLGIEDASPQGPRTYLISATRREQVSQAQEALQVAAIEVYVERSNEGTSVRVVTEQVTRTSMQGQSSEHRRDYARRLFNRLDDVLTLTPEARASNEGRSH